MIGLLFLSLAIVVSTLIVSSTLMNIKRASETITVTGSAKRPIQSDFVIWRGSVSTRQPTMQQGYQDLTRYLKRIRQYFQEAGIPDSLIEIGAISSYSMPEYNAQGRDTGRILGYALSQNFEIRSEMVDKITDLSRSITDLINEGIPLNSFAPEYIFTELAGLRIEMLADATKDAKLRAEQIAQSTGQKVGPVRDAKMGVFQVTARNSTAVSDYGMYNTTTIDKDVTAVVRISFALE